MKHMLSRLLCSLFGHPGHGSTPQGLSIMIVCPRCKAAANLPALLYQEAKKKEMVEEMFDGYFKIQ